MEVSQVNDRLHRPPITETRVGQISLEGMRKFFVASILSSRSGDEAPGLMHPPRYGSLGDTQYLRRLGMAELLTGHEDDGIAIDRLHPGDRALEPDEIVEIATVLPAI
jgi:hypothetical protein